MLPLPASSFVLPSRSAFELLAAIADHAGFTPRRSEREHGELAKEWRSPGRYFSVGSKQAYWEGTQLTALFSRRRPPPPQSARRYENFRSSH